MSRGGGGYVQEVCIRGGQVYQRVGMGVYQRAGSRYTGGSGGRRGERGEAQVYHRVGVDIPEGGRTRKTCNNKMHYIYVKIRHF